MCSVCHNHNQVLSSFMTNYISRFVITSARRVPLLDQKVLIIPERLSPLLIFMGFLLLIGWFSVYYFVDYSLYFFFLSVHYLCIHFWLLVTLLVYSNSFFFFFSFFSFFLKFLWQKYSKRKSFVKLVLYVDLFNVFL